MKKVENEIVTFTENDNDNRPIIMEMYDGSKVRLYYYELQLLVKAAKAFLEISES